MSRARVRGFFILALVLAAGIGAGVVMERVLRARASDHAMDPVSLMRTLDRELGLDVAQRADIGAILARRQAAIDSAWRAVQPAVRSAIDSSQMEISAVLRAEQRTRFLDLMRTAHAGMK